MSELPAGIDASQRVLVALKEARARLEAAERAATEPIAVIGIGCRFPGGADTPDEYWRLLLDGIDASGDIPRNRYDAGAYYDPRPGLPGKMYVRRGAFLPAIEEFDAAFFAISPREAVSLDPQQRLLLEVTWEALEHAGQAPDQLRGSRSGVFVGVGRTDYAHKLLRAGPETMTAWHATGNGLCYGPGRLAHVLDLRGPNMAVDTACSSSLVAVHLACQSLRLRECDLAIAGGCHVHLSPQVAIMLSASRALAADGRSKTFDAAADGFGQGEGCGIVVLRRLSDALDRRDNILALIRGSAINHDGHSSGLTVPNQAAQEQVIRDAVANARIEPHEIGFVEAHGTGTALGDPIEVEALAAVLCRERSPDRPLRVGSVKTNIGHLEAAAGIAGLIKVVLTLQHGRIPPHLHLRQPNPRIAWDDLPIRIPTEATPWPRTAKRRLAGVSSFGMSGTNAHAILQEPPALPAGVQECERPLHAVALSARSPSALREQARRLEAHLATNEDLPLPDVAFTTNTGRTHFPVRVGLVAAARAELTGQLSAVAAGEIRPDIVDEDEAEPPGVAFLFSGQGSQYAGMARQLYATQPVVRGVLDRCDEILRPLLPTSLCETLFADANDGRLDQTLYTQPALFAIEYALAELWRSWGVVPRAVLGHSVGEYVAACVAGVLGLEDGLRLIAERARLMQALPGGNMAAIFAGESRVRDAIGARQDVSVAAINGADNVVIAGSPGSVSVVLARLEAEGIGFRELSVSHAFHSPMMDPILRPFAAAARNVNYAAPRIDLMSNVTGQPHAQAPTAEYWVRHVREPVRFADGLDTLARAGHRIFVEIGPGTALLGIARRNLGDVSPLLLPTLVPGKEEWRPLLETVTRLYTRGIRIDWAGFDRDYARRRLPLPTYPFERHRFWCEDGDDAVPARQSEWTIPAYRLTWPESSPQSLAARPREAGSWIIFADHDGISARLGRMLEDRGDRCIHVDAGDAFARISPTRWTIDPGRRADFAQLLEEIPDPAGWKGIVFAWTCDPAPSAEPSAEELMASQMRSCSGILHLVQTLATHPRGKAPLWLVTRNAVALDSAMTEMPDLSHSSVSGMAKTIALEHPELWGGMIDSPLHPDDDALTQLVRELERQGGEDHVLIRDGKRLAARIEPFVSPSADRVALRPDAAYLITGGLGGLGLHVARWMVERGARNIVLLGRQEPSPAAQAAISDLRRGGASVTTVSADVAEAADLGRVFSQMQTALPMLRGVVHAAGVYGYDLLGELDEHAFERLLRPKVQGGWLLHQLTERLDLDFFVCFSSIAALWGSKGQAHYAAANSFLDALAHYRHRRGLPAVSIGWGPWMGDGMVTGEAHGWLARIGVRSLRPEDALAALDRGLCCGEAQIAIADMDWERFRELYAFGGNRGLLANIAPAETRDVAMRAPPPARLEAEFSHLTITERRDWLVAHLQREVSAVLGIGDEAAPDARAGFFRLGMDSLMAVDLRDRLARTFAVPLSATIVFDYPNIAELAAFLATDALGWEKPAQAAEPGGTVASAGPAHGGQSGSGNDLQEAIALKLARLETLVRET